MPREVKEWKGARDSTPPPPRVRLRVLDRYNGKCPICTLEILGSFACDHIVALINGGLNVESNLQPLCKWCHAKKTAEDVADKAKVAAVRRKSHQLSKYKRPGFRGWRRFNGEPVRRDEK